MIAENVNPGNITSSFLNVNISQCKKEINSFKKNNNIQYQSRGNGYSGYSMSNNAVASYEGGVNNGDNFIPNR